VKFFERLKRKIQFFSDEFKIIDLFFTRNGHNWDKQKNVIIFDTALESDNLGDEIIRKYCLQILNYLGIKISKFLPTHKVSVMGNLDSYESGDLKIVLGTNIISNCEEHDFIWYKPRVKYLKNLCLLGCGANDYHKRLNFYSRLFYKKMLDKTIVHSVRDSYTEQLLKKAGIENVVNTACPTMWNLTPDHCKQIPHSKSKIVVTTLTDYNQNVEKDYFLLDTLIEEYESVNIWIQGKRDLKYFELYPKKEMLNIIDHTLQAFEKFLESNDCDYVGTRLHAGIHALNKKKRSIIIAVDDRALRISADTNLPVIYRNEIVEKLVSFINSDFETNIKLPHDKIQKWKEQFTIQN